MCNDFAQASHVTTNSCNLEISTPRKPCILLTGLNSKKKGNIYIKMYIFFFYVSTSNHFILNVLGLINLIFFRQVGSDLYGLTEALFKPLQQLFMSKVVAKHYWVNNSLFSSVPLSSSTHFPFPFLILKWSLVPNGYYRPHLRPALFQKTTL